MSKREEKQFSFPIYDLVERLNPFLVRPIAHKNAYDFTQKHRHHYFELLFFENGGGTQLIDFKEYPVLDHSCYIVLPNQIHLLRRAPGAHGFLVQFYSEMLSSETMSRFIQTRGWNDMSGRIFENDIQKFGYFKNLFELVNPIKESNPFLVERDRHMLHAALFDLLSDDFKDQMKSSSDSLINSFLNLVEEHYKKEHLVKYYSAALQIGTKKLTEISNKHLGLSPLKVIHRRILLEAKRLLLFKNKSQKEIAYELGFDSPPSFSAFVKGKTGLTPSSLQKELDGIHN